MREREREKRTIVRRLEFYLIACERENSSEGGFSNEGDLERKSIERLYSYLYRGFFFFSPTVDVS